MSPLAQARTAGPLAVDTGPPVPGAPPFSTEGLQKEVTATELKPQAKILDLLETILPTIFAGIDQSTKAEANGLESLALNLGELKAKVELPEFSDILVAMGVPVPTGTQTKTPEEFKNAVAQAVVDAALPAPVKALFARVVRAMGEAPTKSDTTKSSQLPVIKNDVIVPLGELVAPVDVASSDTSVRQRPVYVGPPITGSMPPELVGPPIMGTFPPELVGPPVVGASTLEQGRPAPVSDSRQPRDRTDISRSAHFAGPRLSRMDRVRSAHTGDPIERQIVEALNVTRVDVAQSETIDLDAAVAAVRDQSLLQKAPVRTIGIDPAVKPEAAAVATIQTLSKANTKLIDRSSADVAPSKVTSADRSVPAPSPLSKKQETKDAAVGTDEKDGDIDTPVAEQTVEHDSDVLAGNERDNALAADRPNRQTETKVKLDAQPTTEQVQTAKQKVIEQIEEIAATRKNGRVTMKLSPDDLGTITLAVRSLGSEIETKVTASNENVRHALHAHRAELVQSVESRGLTMNSFTVGSEAPQDQQGNQKQDQPTRQDFARSHNLWAHKSDTQAKPTYARLSHAGVDTFA